MSDRLHTEQLRQAFKHGDASACRQLLDAGLSLHARYQGCSLLYWNALCGHVDVCRLLLERGADPLACEPDGQTALHAAVKGDCGEGNAAICKMLLDAGVLATACDDDGDTPVSLALLTKQIELWRMLVVQDAMPYVRNAWRSERDRVVHGMAEFAPAPAHVISLMQAVLVSEKMMFLD